MFFRLVLASVFLGIMLAGMTLAGAFTPPVSDISIRSSLIPDVSDSPVLSRPSLPTRPGTVAEPITPALTTLPVQSTPTLTEAKNITRNSTFFTPADITLKSQAMVNGKIVDRRIIGPGLPPPGFVATADRVNPSDVSVTSLSPADVPAMTWSYGCSATSATMAFGYYDRTGYPEMYTGQTDDSLFPLTNEVWGLSSEGNGQCPLTASQYGLDGRTTRGHKDDYYYRSGSSTDPYYGSWSEHSPPDCIADFMGTSMYRKYGNSDGGTTFWYYTDGSPTYDFSYYDSTSRDGIHGMRLFAESRGYSVSTNYNQYIDALGLAYGFTYNQYKAEIDAGFPVLIQVSGHTMLGIGYSSPNTIILRNTWVYSTHTMPWGGSYQGMDHLGVGVIHLDPPPVIAKFFGVPEPEIFPLTIHFYDASVGYVSSWNWDFGDGSTSNEQNPTHTYTTPGTFTVHLTVSSD